MSRKVARTLASQVTARWPRLTASIGWPRSASGVVAHADLTAGISREIKVERFGNALQVDLDSLHRYQDLGTGRGTSPER